MHYQAVRRAGAPLLRAQYRREARGLMLLARALSPRRPPSAGDVIAVLIVAAAFVLFAVGVLLWGAGVDSWPLWGAA
jgi:hypothetical protein